MHKLFKLKSGIRVILIPKKETEVVTIACGFAVGSKNEGEKEQGISHFLEHMIFKGAKRRKTALEVAKFIDSLGAKHNAFTSKEYTGYYVKVASKYFEKALDFLSDNLVNSSLPKREIEKEREVILEEIDMHEDIPFDKVTDTIESALFSGNSLSKEISGTKKIVQLISREDLINYKKRYYSKDNLVIAVSGNYNSYNNQELLNLIEKYFRDLPNSVAKEDGYQKNYDKILLYPKKIEQTNFILAFGGPSESNEDKYLVRILTKILSGSMSSRLFVRIREELGLVYAVEGFVSSYGDNGSIQIYLGLDKQNINLALKEILKEIQKIVKNGITLEELNNAKRMITTKILINSEDSADLALDYLTDLLICNKIETPKEMMNKYNSVTLEDVNTIAKKYLSTDIYLSAVGPGLDKKKINKIISKY